MAATMLLRGSETWMKIDKLLVKFEQQEYNF
jgi:hypothetical protein